MPVVELFWAATPARLHVWFCATLSAGVPLVVVIAGDWVSAQPWVVFTVVFAAAAVPPSMSEAVSTTADPRDILVVRVNLVMTLPFLCGYYR